MEILTVKQEKFADEYISNGGNGTKAAIAAGYGDEGKGYNHASVAAYHLIRNPKIMQKIQDEKTSIAVELNIELKARIQNTLNVYEKSIEDNDFANAMRANENLHKVFGDYEAKKTEVSLRDERQDLEDYDDVREH